MMTSDAMVAQLRKERELTVPVAGWVFHARRPTDIEAGSLLPSESSVAALCVRYVTGWDGVRVCDIVGGDDESAVPFSRDLWEEWVSDRPEVFGPVGLAVMDAYTSFCQQRASARKN